MQSNSRRTLSVLEAADLVGVHKLTLYKAIRRGELRVIRVGRRVLVPSEALERLLQGQPWAPSASARRRVTQKVDP